MLNAIRAMCGGRGPSHLSDGQNKIVVLSEVLPADVKTWEYGKGRE